MGSGSSYRCCVCNTEHDIIFGVGFMYGIKNEKATKEALAGKYGQRWKKIIKDNPSYIVDTEYFLYYCKKCGYWENSPSLSIYRPKTPNSKINYFMLPDERKLYRSYYHKCPKCQTRMKKYDERFIPFGLKCRKCGSDSLIPLFKLIDWD